MKTNRKKAELNMSPDKEPVSAQIYDGTNSHKKLRYSHNDHEFHKSRRKQIITKSVLFLAVVFIAVVIALIIDNRTAEVPKQPVLVNAQPVDATVDINQKGFMPNTLVLSLNSKVTWRNVSEIKQNLQSNNIEGLINPFTMEKDDQLTYTFDKPGTYEITLSGDEVKMTIIVE